MYCVTVLDKERDRDGTGYGVADAILSDYMGPAKCTFDHGTRHLGRDTQYFVELYN